MKSALRIVSEFERKDHPLGKSIYRGEVPLLVSQLIIRLGIPESELNYEPTSLKRLEDKLFELSLSVDLQIFSEEEIVQLVREITAYLGEVLVLHANGRWESLGTLLSTNVIVEGDIKIVKEGQRRVVPSVAFRPGFTGAGAWDMIIAGRKPILFREYVDAKKKTIKEELGRKK